MRRLALALGVAVALVVAGWLLFGRGSGTEPKRGDADTDRRDRDTSAQLGGARASTVKRLGPRRDEARRTAPSKGRPRFRNKRLRSGELETTPPLFDAAEDRKAYRKWWVKEGVRRANIYMKLVPDHKYPSADEVEQLFEDWYDTAEPRGPDESVEDAYTRRKRHRTIHHDFRTKMGGSPKTVISRGGDPQHGKPAPRPFEPPNILDSGQRPAYDKPPQPKPKGN